jgi:hypothetical protein
MVGSMKMQIARRLSPEEEELAKKRDELAGLQADLADRELYLAFQSSSSA